MKKGQLSSKKKEEALKKKKQTKSAEAPEREDKETKSGDGSEWPLEWLDENGQLDDDKIFESM